MALAAIAVLTACSDPDPGGTGGAGGGGSGGSGTTSSTGSGVAGPGCPDLRGTFTCPPVGAPSEYTLTVTQSFDGQSTTTYQLHYSFNDTTGTYAASPEGISNGGSIQQCTPYQGVPSLAIYPAGAPGSATYNFINPGGDYQADYMGNPLVCTRSN